MSADRDVSRIVRSWLNEDAYEDATRVLDAVLDQIDTTPQRRAVWPVRRILTMNSAVRIGVAAVAVIAIALIGVNLYRGSGVGSSPSDSPRASTTPRLAQTPIPVVLTRPTDIPTDGTCEEDRLCLGLLEVPNQHAQVFSPHFTFTVPVHGIATPPTGKALFENLDQSDGALTLLPLGKPGDFIGFFKFPLATRPDGSPVTPAVGASVDALSGWLSSNELLTASTPTPVTVGGLQGVRLDLEVAPGAESRPEGCPVQTCASVFLGKDPARLPSWTWDWAIASGEQARVYLLTSSDGVLAIIVDSLDGTTMPSLSHDADDILASVHFE